MVGWWKMLGEIGREVAALDCCEAYGNHAREPGAWKGCKSVQGLSQN